MPLLIFEIKFRPNEPNLTVDWRSEYCTAEIWKHTKLHLSKIPVFYDMAKMAAIMSLNRSIFINVGPGIYLGVG